MFLGIHHPRLDEKGRLFLPARFRDQLAEGLVITKGQDRCLYVWPLEEFHRVTQPLRQASITNKGPRDFLRILCAGASDDVPDKQGRVTLPPALRQYAGLTRECVVIGADARLEIWDAEAWAAFEAQQDPVYAGISEEVVPGL